MHVKPAIPAYPLVDLTPELLELILAYLGPHDLINFACTCHRALEYIRPTNRTLWKAAFLQVFDHPKHAWAFLTPTARAANRSREDSWNWHTELRRRCTAFREILQADPLSQKNIEHVITTLLEVSQTASYTNTADNGESESLNLNFLLLLKDKAPHFDRYVHDFKYGIEVMSLPLAPEAEHDRPITRSMLARRVAVPEWASRFHIIYGPTKREKDSIWSKAAARAIVYDWASTGPDAEYGPLNNDRSGTVNWPMLEAISSLMHRVFDTSLKGYRLLHLGFNMNMPAAAPRDFSYPKDWAGVTGQWLGTYAFLDYRALVHYNFANDRQNSMDLGNHDEACGDLMYLELAIDDSEELKKDRRLQTSLPSCRDHPTIFFQGTSEDRHSIGPPIGVRGSASLTPGGREVRWRFVIRYADADQWQLEGVQPGGIRTGPIYGLWTHVEHDENGPTGPFYYCPLDLVEYNAGYFPDAMDQVMMV